MTMARRVLPALGGIAGVVNVRPVADYADVIARARELTDRSRNVDAVHTSGGIVPMETRTDLAELAAQLMRDYAELREPGVEMIPQTEHLENAVRNLPEESDEADRLDDSYTMHSPLFPVPELSAHEQEVAERLRAVVASDGVTPHSDDDIPEVETFELPHGPPPKRPTPRHKTLLNKSLPKTFHEAVAPLCEGLFFDAFEAYSRRPKLRPLYTVVIGSEVEFFYNFCDQGHRSDPGFFEEYCMDEDLYPIGPNNCATSEILDRLLHLYLAHDNYGQGDVVNALLRAGARPRQWADLEGDYPEWHLELQSAKVVRALMDCAVFREHRYEAFHRIMKHSDWVNCGEAFFRLHSSLVPWAWVIDVAIDERNKHLSHRNLHPGAEWSPKDPHFLTKAIALKSSCMERYHTARCLLKEMAIRRQRVRKVMFQWRERAKELGMRPPSLGTPWCLQARGRKMDAFAVSAYLASMGARLRREELATDNALRLMNPDWDWSLVERSVTHLQCTNGVCMGYSILVGDRARASTLCYCGGWMYCVRQERE